MQFIVVSSQSWKAIASEVSDKKCKQIFLGGSTKQNASYKVRQLRVLGINHN